MPATHACIASPTSHPPGSLWNLAVHLHVGQGWQGARPAAALQHRRLAHIIQVHLHKQARVFKQALGGQAQLRQPGAAGRRAAQADRRLRRVLVVAQQALAGGGEGQRNGHGRLEQLRRHAVRGQAEAAQHRHRLRGAAFIIGVEEFCRLRHTAQVCEEEELPLFCIALLLCTL